MCIETDLRLFGALLRRQVCIRCHVSFLHCDRYALRDLPQDNNNRNRHETFLKGIKVIGEALVQSLMVEKDSTFKGLLSSEVFTSGFPRRNRLGFVLERGA